MKPINSEKERIIILVNQILDRSGLSIDQVIARMQVDGCEITRNTFENRFTTRVHQKPNVPDIWLLSFMRAMRTNLAEAEKCTVAEALELCQLTRFPLQKMTLLRELFSLTEFHAAVRTSVNSSYFSLIQSTIDADNLLAKDVSLPLATKTNRLEKRLFEWGNVPNFSQCYGRTIEIGNLAEWLQYDSCRLVGIFGVAGIGKSLLAAHITTKLNDQFDRVFWYSLQHSPTIFQFFDAICSFLSGQEGTSLAGTFEKRSELLLHYLQQERVLVILDGFETLMESSDSSGIYQLGHRDYGTWLRQYIHASHQSHLIITSREEPIDWHSLQTVQEAVRSLTLDGLPVDAVRQTLNNYHLQGADHDWAALTTHYSGNPAALMFAAEPIVSLFDGVIPHFLANQASLFQTIRDLIEQQFLHLSLLERELLYWLMIEREPTLIEVLQEDIGESVPRLHLLEALRSLMRRSLVKQQHNYFGISHLIQIYLLERIIELIVNEVEAGIPLMLSSFTLLKTQSKEHLREIQRRTIIAPILERLVRFLGTETVAVNLLSMLYGLQQHPSFSGTYAAGNLLNLLTQLNIDLRGQDFSNLEIRQADLRTINLQDVNFSNTTFSETRFWENFSSISALAYSQDGQSIVAGTTNGEIHLWSVKQEELRYRLLGHTDMIWDITFSPDGTLLASACEDHAVRIWEVISGECLHVLTDHHDWVKGVCFLDQGRQLASVGHDATVRIWDVSSGECLTEWVAHQSWIWSVACSPNETLLATASQDHLVKIWHIETGMCIHSLSGHTEPVRTVAFSPDSQHVMSAGFDQTIRIWDVMTGELKSVLHGHENLIWSATYTPDGKRIISGGDDPHIYIWNVETEMLDCRLEGHQNRLWAVAVHPNNQQFASGGDDQRLRFWNIENQQLLRYFAGYSNQIWSIAIHPHLPLMASGGDDGTVRIWEHETSQPQKFLQGHSERVRCIAYSHDGKTVITGSDDHSIRLWDVQRNVCLHTLWGHQNRIWSVAYWRRQNRLISCSEDQTIRLWNMETGQPVRTLYTEGGRVWSIACHPTRNLLVSSGDQPEILLWDLDSGECIQLWEGHQNRVWKVVFNPDGTRLASGSADHTVVLWDTDSGQIHMRLQGHHNAVWTVAFSPDGQWLASSGDDHYICIWDVETGTLYRTLYGHTGCVWTLTFLSNTTLVSGGQDEVIRIWDIDATEPRVVLHNERPYERMNIKGIQGLTEAQIASLGTLGAIEI